MPVHLYKAGGALNANRLELPTGAVPDYASYTARMLSASWVPTLKDSLRDLRRNAGDTTNATYITTGSVATFGLGKLPSARFFGTNTNLAAHGYARPASNSRYDNQAAGGCAIWFLMTTAPSGAADNMALMSRSVITTNDGATLYVAYDGGAIRLSCDLTLAGVATTLIGGPTLEIDRLYHAAVVWRAGGQSELYLDGFQIDTEAASPAFTVTGSNIYVAANINVGGGFFTCMTGHVFRADWFGEAPCPGDIHTLSRDLCAGYKTKRRYVLLTGEDEGTPTTDSLSAHDLMWDGDFARDPQEAQTVYWTGAFLRADSVAASTSASMGSTVTWSQACDREPQFGQTLTWTGDAATVGFVAPDNFARDAQTLTWSGQFRSDDSDLANLRYRR